MTEVADLQRWAAEPLDQELVPWVVDGPLGRCLKHPLVYDLSMALPGHANHMLAHKKEALAEALEAGDWHRVIFLHERPWRPHALLEYVVGYDEEGYPLSLDRCPEETRDLAVSVWLDSENIEECIEDWIAMFDLPPGFWLGDREAFDALPDPVRAYRAHIEDGDWSWSTDRKVAEFFARRFGANHRIETRLIEKARVFGYVTDRNESELLVHTQPLEQKEHHP